MPQPQNATVKTTHDTILLWDLVEILKKLCSERRTGTLFVHTDTNHSARIGMDEGRIFFVACGRYRGMDAIEQIKTMQYGKYSFSESIFKSGVETQLPPTRELLAQLGLAAVGDLRGIDLATEASSARNGAPPSLPSSDTASRPAPPPSARRSLPGGTDDRPLQVTGERLYDLVAEALALSIGPVASVVCDEYRNRLETLSSPREYRPLIVQIASELGGPDESSRFIARALAAAGL
jgi:hypothetical protein